MGRMKARFKKKKKKNSKKAKTLTVQAQPYCLNMIQPVGDTRAFAGTKDLYDLPSFRAHGRQVISAFCGLCNLVVHLLCGAADFSVISLHQCLQLLEGSGFERLLGILRNNIAIPSFDDVLEVQDGLELNIRVIQGWVRRCFEVVHKCADVTKLHKLLPVRSVF